MLQKLDYRFLLGHCKEKLDYSLDLKLTTSLSSDVLVGVVSVDFIIYNFDLEWVLDPTADPSEDSWEVNVDLVKSLTINSSLLEELEAEVMGNFSICLGVLKHFLDT